MSSVSGSSGFEVPPERPPPPSYDEALFVTSKFAQTVAGANSAPVHALTEGRHFKQLEYNVIKPPPPPYPGTRSIDSRSNSSDSETTKSSSSSKKVRWAPEKNVRAIEILRDEDEFVEIKTQDENILENKSHKKILEKLGLEEGRPKKKRKSTPIHQATDVKQIAFIFDLKKGKITATRSEVEQSYRILKHKATHLFSQGKTFSEQSLEFKHRVTKPAFKEMVILALTLHHKFLFPSSTF